MPYQPTTNFNDSNGVDLGKKLVTKDYLLEVYGTILESTGNSGLTVSPSLWVWGYNFYGQLGINNVIFSILTPVTTFAGGTNWKQVSCGTLYTAAIKTDGTLWTWGANYYGQLGTNTIGPSNSPDKSIPVTTFAGGTNWKLVASAGYTTTAIKTDGTLWTWGYNYYGQLGINNTNIRSIPVTTILGGTNWKQVACGQYHTAAIKTDGTLWVWGRNSYGQLGINNLTQKNTPVTTILGGTNWKQVSCGFANIAAIKTDGTLWIWGINSNGQLGVNDTTGRSIPVTTFAGGTNWKQVSTSNGHITAIKTDGTLWTWGYNQYGGLGINNIADRSTPVTTFAGGTNWKQVAGGTYNTAAIKTDGTLWVWGNNFTSQLGINNSADRSIPVTTFLGGTNWKSVAGGSQTAAIQSVDYI
jgi:alpha-tubulin suppressor-like RCC1 family protein